MMPLGGLKIGYLAEHLGPVAAVRINVALCLAAVAALLAWSRVEEVDEKRRLAWDLAA